MGQLWIHNQFSPSACFLTLNIPVHKFYWRKRQIEKFDNT